MLKKKTSDKMFIIGICILVLSIPISSAVDVNTNVHNESSENTEIGTLDNNREIISIIHGSCSNIAYKGKGLIRRVEIWSKDPTWIEIIGFKRHIFGSFQVTTHHLIAPCFIGISISNHPIYMAVHGIALGNIEWE